MNFSKSERISGVFFFWTINNELDLSHIHHKSDFWTQCILIFLSGCMEPVNCLTRPPWPRPSYLKHQVNLLKLLTLDTVSRRAHKPCLGCRAFRKQAEIQLALSYLVLWAGKQEHRKCQPAHYPTHISQLKNSPIDQFEVKLIVIKIIYSFSSHLTALSSIHS